MLDGDQLPCGFVFAQFNPSEASLSQNFDELIFAETGVHVELLPAANIQSLVVLDITQILLLILDPFPIEYSDGLKYMMEFAL